MSNIDAILEITRTNQDLFIDLNEKDAETVSRGAYEAFTVKNQTQKAVSYSVDGTSWYHLPKANNGGGWVWTTFNGGEIKFDQDTRPEYTDYKSYNLYNGGIFAFRENTTTTGNPFDIELYDITNA